MLTIESAVVSEKPTEVATGTTGELTDDQLLGLSEDDSDKGDVSSDSSNETIVPETLSSWSIKDLERNFKTFPENFVGLHRTLFVWVIMDMKAKDP